ncbi:MAG: hypothetical protein NWE86_03940 [Candidatus Bathyarchaeota archaeon]|nr:hypothetical protein [Candidatus Bathyarchaeota archaeon]
MRRARASTRYIFTQWSGGTSGTNYGQSEPIIMNAPKIATADWQRTLNPVGGYFSSVNKLAILVPYITLVGLIGALSSIFMTIKKYRT